MTHIGSCLERRPRLVRTGEADNSLQHNRRVIVEENSNVQDKRGERANLVFQEKQEEFPQEEAL